MTTNTSKTKEGIDKRTLRAATESMTVVPYGGGSSMFDVFSGTNAEPYVVDLRDGLCSCPDFVNREPAGGCKHQRRVRIEFGIEDVPAELRSEHSSPTDVELARRRRGLDQPKPVSIESEAAAYVRHSEARQVATDGGRDLDEADACENGEVGCNGPDADKLPCFDCYRTAAR